VEFVFYHGVIKISKIKIYSRCIGIRYLQAALAALIVEKTGGKELKKSLKTAVGAGPGRLVGLGAKFIAGVVIWIIFTIAAFVN
jgi:hypothetical protein